MPPLIRRRARTSYPRLPSVRIDESCARIRISTLAVDGLAVRAGGMARRPSPDCNCDPISETDLPRKSCGGGQAVLVLVVLVYLNRKHPMMMHMNHSDHAKHDEDVDQKDHNMKMGV